MNIRHFVEIFFIIIFCAFFITRSEPFVETGIYESAQMASQGVEFDYVTWTLDSLGLKISQGALNPAQYLSQADQKDLVYRYFDLVGQIEDVEARIERIYADPNVIDPAQTASILSKALQGMKNRRDQLQPVVESILQQQVAAILVENQLSLGGQVLPPVLYHVTSLPLALIVSPRDAIRQEANISLLSDLTMDEIIQLEKNVEARGDVSALVVPVGGIGIYPTMVMSTTNIEWQIETIAHEWTHNYLTLRPLGLNYETTPELRTMNETTASLVGKEIGRQVLERYYPELIKPEVTADPTLTPTVTETPEAPVFNYRKEMRTTRVRVDELLAAGKIEEAESYMEERRQFFWENGYQIRRINQAYFAFYGAYADSSSSGESGEDPVGPAVVSLRDKSVSLAEFLNQMSWMTSFEQLKAAVR